MAQLEKKIGGSGRLDCSRWWTIVRGGRERGRGENIGVNVFNSDMNEIHDVVHVACVEVQAHGMGEEGHTQGLRVNFCSFS